VHAPQAAAAASIACYFSFQPVHVVRIDIWPDHWAASPRTLRRTFQLLSKFDDRETGAISRLIPRAQPQ
jgi:hypothetical protein